MNKAQREAHEAAEKLAAKSTETATTQAAVAAGPSIEQLQAELAAANAKLEKFGVGKNIDAGVRERMALGMDRESATTCARRQAAHDDVLARKGLNDTERQEALIQAASIS